MSSLAHLIDLIISLLFQCWAAASITDQKVDKKESLMLAKQDLGYQCSEEEVSSVYTKMRSLKKVYLADSKKNKKVYLETDNITCLNQDSLLGDDFSRGPLNVNNGELQCSSYIEKGVEREIGESSANKEHADIINEMQIVQKKCHKRMQKLIQKQLEQIEEVSQTWKCERDKMEIDYKLESAVVRTIHGPNSMDKLKLLDVDFNNKIKNHDILKDAELKRLRDEHLAIINEERKRATDWLAKVKSRSREPEVAASGCVHSPGQPSLHTEQTTILPDSWPQVCAISLVYTHLSSLFISPLLVFFYSSLVKVKTNQAYSVN